MGWYQGRLPGGMTSKLGTIERVRGTRQEGNEAVEYSWRGREGHTRNEGGKVLRGMVMQSLISHDKEGTLSPNDNGKATEGI